MNDVTNTHTPAPPAPLAAATAVSRHAAAASVAAVERMVSENMALVGWAVNRYARAADEDSVADREDAVSAGYRALFSAAERFDATRGAAFSTFATYGVLSAVRNSLFRSRKEKREAVSLDAPLDITGGSALVDLLPDTTTASPEASVVDTLSAADLWRRIDRAALTERQRNVLALRYRKDLSKAETAAQLGVTKQAVDVIERRALVTLRSVLTQQTGAAGVGGAAVAALRN